MWKGKIVFSQNHLKWFWWNVDLMTQIKPIKAIFPEKKYIYIGSFREKKCKSFVWPVVKEKFNNRHELIWSKVCGMWIFKTPKYVQTENMGWNRSV